MIITPQALRGIYTAFNTVFNKAFEGQHPTYEKVATVVPSTSESETYAWLGDIPGMREWIGEREIQNLSGSAYDNILVKSSVTVSQNISVTVTTDTADTDEAVENRIKAILTELLAVRRSRKLNELTLSDINHAIRSGYSGATNAAVSEPEADVKLGKDKVIILGDVSVTIERE